MEIKPVKKPKKEMTLGVKVQRLIRTKTLNNIKIIIKKTPGPSLH